MSVVVPYSFGLSVVVPVYNSEATLIELVSRIEMVLRRLSPRFEVVLVNDGSRDRSWDVIRKLAEQHGWVRGIDLMRNYGQHNALLCGIRAAQFEIIVTLDDDLQNPPEEIPRLLERLVGGYDVVYGTPQEKRHEFWRNFGSAVTRLTLRGIVGVEVARNVSTFRAFRTKLRGAFGDYQSPYVSIDVLLTWATTRFAAIPVRHDTRQFGKTNYTLRKLVISAFDMLTGFSIFPLQLASLLGFAFTLFGVAVLIYVTSSYLIYGSTVSGFPFLASIIAIFSGVQLFSLGIIGEYLARMHFRTIGKPPYVIRTQSESKFAGSLRSKDTVA